MDVCPRCRSAERTERATAIVATGAQPLGGLLWCPPPPPMPGNVKAYRACMAIGGAVTLMSIGSTVGVRTQEDADAAVFGATILPFAMILLIIGFVLMLASAGVRRRWQADKRAHVVLTRLWPLLVYCHRCAVVFLAGGTFATESAHASRFLWDTACQTLWARVPRPPGT